MQPRSQISPYITIRILPSFQPSASQKSFAHTFLRTRWKKTGFWRGNLIDVFHAELLEVWRVWSLDAATGWCSVDALIVEDSVDIMWIMWIFIHSDSSIRENFYPLFIFSNLPILSLMFYSFFMSIWLYAHLSMGLNMDLTSFQPSFLSLSLYVYPYACKYTQYMQWYINKYMHTMYS